MRWTVGAPRASVVRRILALAVALLGCRAGWATSTLDTIVVTATRSAANRFDVPASVDVLGRDDIGEGKLQVNLSESLGALAGVSAQNRQNYAQDLQISVRGFGARSSFGVRGVRLYTDGIPATLPDGQGQVSNFDLVSAGRLEVLRGPFSALYGNSSGGVIALYTADAPPGAQLDASIDYGSFNTQRYALKASGHPLGADGVLDVARFTTDGYRNHSAAVRDNLNGRWRFTLSDRTRVTLIANAIDTPQAQDPLGLTRAQLGADPRQAGTNAVSYDTRKSIQQEQLGASMEHRLADGSELSLMLYGGQRRTTQFQSIPQAVQTPPSHPGGVIDLARNYRGTDLHWSRSTDNARGEFKWTAGVAYDGVDEARRGYLNFMGTQLGVQGALRRSEANRVFDFDQYLQLQWSKAGRWLALAGVRNSRVDVRSNNHLAAAGVPVSGVHYQAVSPVAGLSYRLAPRVSVYGAYGRGFETPTLNELAYQLSGTAVTAGLNAALRASRSDNVEVGLKSGAEDWEVTLALFHTRAVDELAAQISSFGRTVFLNIPQTRRQGAELQWSARLGSRFDARAAYTYLDATVAQSYRGSGGIVNVGAQLPAVARQTLYGAVGYRPFAGTLSINAELTDRSQLFVNDLNSDAASGYFSANLHLDLRQRAAHWHFTEALRLDNLLDRRYVGTVIVNESNQRFFEPSPGRSFYVLFSAAGN